MPDGASGRPAAVPADAARRFAHFCASCHGAADALAGRLPLGDLGALAKWKARDGRTLIEMVRSGAMPPVPAEAAAAIGLTAAIRAEMVEALEALR